MTARIYALYSDMETAITAVNDVIMKGVLSKYISVITHDPDEKYAHYIDIDDDDLDSDEGASFGAMVGALTGLAVALIPGFGPVFATGPLAAAISATIGAGTGAFLGGVTAALVDFGVSEDAAEYYERVLREGGALVIVDTHNDAEEDMVESVLESHIPLEIED